MPEAVRVNRAPVLTLWAAIVAERLGHDRESALTLGKAVAGMNAQAKGRRLGIYSDKPPGEPDRRSIPERETRDLVLIELLGRGVPARKTEKGVRAVEKSAPVNPAGVERYLAGKIGANLPAIRAAMEDLARSYAPEELAARAYDLYESFRPNVPEGVRGWGAVGELDLDRIRALAKNA